MFKWCTVSGEKFVFGKIGGDRRLRKNVCGERDEN